MSKKIKSRAEVGFRTTAWRLRAYTCVLVALTAGCSWIVPKVGVQITRNTQIETFTQDYSGLSDKNIQKAIESLIGCQNITMLNIHYRGPHDPSGKSSFVNRFTTKDIYMEGWAMLNASLNPLDPSAFVLDVVGQYAAIQRTDSWVILTGHFKNRPTRAYKVDNLVGTNPFIHVDIEQTIEINPPPTSWPLLGNLEMSSSGKLAVKKKEKPGERRTQDSDLVKELNDCRGDSGKRFFGTIRYRIHLLRPYPDKDILIINYPKRHEIMLKSGPGDNDYSVIGYLVFDHDNQHDKRFHGIIDLRDRGQFLNDDYEDVYQRVSELFTDEVKKEAQKREKQRLDEQLKEQLKEELKEELKTD